MLGHRIVFEDTCVNLDAGETFNGWVTGHDLEAKILVLCAGLWLLSVIADFNSLVRLLVVVNHNTIGLALKHAFQLYLLVFNLYVVHCKFHVVALSHVANQDNAQADQKCHLKQCFEIFLFQSIRDLLVLLFNNLS